MKNKLVFGVGINDADYHVYKYDSYRDQKGKLKQRVLWKCPFYARWKDMLMRCYSEKYKAKNTTYKNCSVCDEWLIFTNFRKWMANQDWQNKVLDKDLLVRGNKVYSPSTCLFISYQINNFISSSINKTSLLEGVSISGDRFRAFCKNPFTKKNIHLGLYDTELEAHQAWYSAKKKHALELAEKLEDLKVKDALKNFYK